MHIAPQQPSFFTPPPRARARRYRRNPTGPLCAEPSNAASVQPASTPFQWQVDSRGKPSWLGGESVTDMAGWVDGEVRKRGGEPYVRSRRQVTGFARDVF